MFQYSVDTVQGKLGLWAPSYLEDRRVTCEFQQLSRVPSGILRASGKRKLRQAIRVSVISRVLEAPAFFPFLPSKYPLTANCRPLWIGHFGCCERFSEQYRVEYCQEHGEEMYTQPVILFDYSAPAGVAGALAWFGLKVTSQPRVPALMCCDMFDDSWSLP